MAWQFYFMYHTRYWTPIYVFKKNGSRVVWCRVFPVPMHVCARLSRKQHIYIYMEFSGKPWLNDQVKIGKKLLNERHANVLHQADTSPPPPRGLARTTSSACMYSYPPCVHGMYGDEGGSAAYAICAIRLSRNLTRLGSDLWWKVPKRCT